MKYRVLTFGAWIVLLSAAICCAQTQQSAAPQSTTAGGGTNEDASRPATAATPSTTPQVNPGEYLLGAEDVLSINVWKEPEISRTVPVRPDGKISLPLVGELKASGLTPLQLQAELKQQLVKYMESAEVTVIVQEAKSHRFTILGEVVRPGAYPVVNATTVLDAIALAGGLRDFAKSKDIYVLQVKSDGSQARLPFNYKDVVKGRRAEQNVMLEPRDTVVVP